MERDERRERAKEIWVILLLRASELKGGRKGRKGERGRGAQSSFHDWICEGRAKGIGSSWIYWKSSKLPAADSHYEIVPLINASSFLLFLHISGPRESRAGLRLVRVRAEERAVRSVLEVQSVEEGGTPVTSE